MAKRAAKKSKKKTRKAAARSKPKPRRLAPMPLDDHAHVDCCDMDFAAGEQTLDQDLPAARVGRMA